MLILIYTKTRPSLAFVYPSGPFKNCSQISLPFLACVTGAKRGEGEGRVRFPSPTPLPFSLPYYPLPLSTLATQANPLQPLKSHPFFTPEAWKGTLFVWSLPVYAIIGSTPFTRMKHGWAPRNTCKSRCLSVTSKRPKQMFFKPRRVHPLRPRGSQPGPVQKARRTFSSRADKCWAVKRALRSSFNV